MGVEFFFRWKLVVDLFYHLNKCNERNCYLKYNASFYDLVLVGLYSKNQCMLKCKNQYSWLRKSRRWAHVVVVAHRKLQEGFSWTIRKNHGMFKSWKKTSNQSSLINSNNAKEDCRRTVRQVRPSNTVIWICLDRLILKKTVMNSMPNYNIILKIRFHVQGILCFLNWNNEWDISN